MKNFFVIISLLLAGCSSVEKAPSTVPNSDFTDLVEKYSDHAEKYDGFTNLFNIRATLLNQSIVESQLEQKAAYWMWSDQKKKEEKESSAQEMSQKTQVFVAFFSPNRKHDDLDKQQSIWRVFLDTRGRRYIGSVSRVNGVVADIKMQYPYFESFHTAYMATFAVPAADVQSEDAQVVFASSIGSATLSLKALAK